MLNVWLDEPQAGIKIVRINVNNLRYANITTLKAESEEELKSLWMRVRVKKLTWSSILQKYTNIMESGPITSWQIEKGKIERSDTFPFLGSKVSVDNNYSHEIKRHWLFGRKPVTNLGRVLKSRDNILPTKIYSQSYGFSRSHVQIWELDHKEDWALKNWYFQIVMLQKTLESSLDSKEI